MKNGVLDVPGASLHFETGGQGPLLVFIPGGNGDAEIYKPIAQHLLESFTVVVYDRRGFSRSLLRDEQQDEKSAARDADDVRLLIEHLSDQPAVIFGSSSGAVVALQVVMRHPDVVRLLLCHEPPAINWLPEPEPAKWRGFLDEVYETYRREGIQPARQKFIAAVFNMKEGEAMRERPVTASGTDERVARNMAYWFEKEIRQYPFTPLDSDKEVLAGLSHKLVLVCGRQSRGAMPYLPNEAMAKRLGQNVLELPGGHNGYAVHPVEFSQELMDVIYRSVPSSSG